MRHGLVQAVSGGGELDGEPGVEGERRNRGVRVSPYATEELPGITLPEILTAARNSSAAETVRTCVAYMPAL